MRAEVLYGLIGKPSAIGFSPVLRFCINWRGRHGVGTLGDYAVPISGVSQPERFLKARFHIADLRTKSRSRKGWDTSESIGGAFLSLLDEFGIRYSSRNNLSPTRPKQRDDPPEVVFLQNNSKVDGAPQGCEVLPSP